MVRNAGSKVFLQRIQSYFSFFFIPLFVFIGSQWFLWESHLAVAEDVSTADKNKDHQVDAQDLILILNDWNENGLSFEDILPLENQWQKGIGEDSTSGKVSKADATSTPTLTFTVTQTSTPTPTSLSGFPSDPPVFLSASNSGKISKSTLPGPPTGIDIDVAYIERRPRIDFDATQPMPVVGSQVTFRAHINNRGSEPAGMVNYQWYIDGNAAQGQNASGSFILTGSGVMSTHHTQDYLLTWTSTPFDIGISCSLQNGGNDLYSENNSLTINSHSLGVGFYAHKTFSEYFQGYQRNLGIGSNSLEDYLNRMCIHWNYFLERSIYPSLPNGISQSVHLDYVRVVSDPSSTATIGSFGNYADEKTGSRDKTVDFIWGGQYADLPGHLDDYYSTTLGNQFYCSLGIIHEMLHALLVDSYGFDCTMGGSLLTGAISSSASSLILSGTPDKGDPGENGSSYLWSQIDSERAYFLASAENGELLSSPSLVRSNGTTIFNTLSRGVGGTTSQSQSQGTLIMRADCRIVDDGRLVAGTVDLPFSSSSADRALLCNPSQIGSIMGGSTTQFVLGPIDALIFPYVYNRVSRNPVTNQNRGIVGVYRSGDFTSVYSYVYWQYFHNTPSTNILRVIDSNGQPIANASVQIYRSDSGISGNYSPDEDYVCDLYPEFIDNQVDISDLSVTDSNGEISMSYSPFGIHTPTNPHRYGGRSTVLIVAKITKGTNKKYIVCSLPQLSEYYWRNIYNSTSHPGVVPLKVDWSEGTSVTKVLRFYNGGSETYVDTVGNLHANNVKCSCIWGNPLVAFLTDDYTVFDADHTGSFIRIRGSIKGILLSIDENLVPCLQGANVERHSYPEDYGTILRLVSSSGDVITNFDQSGSIVLKSDVVN